MGGREREREREKHLEIWKTVLHLKSDKLLLVLPDLKVYNRQAAMAGGMCAPWRVQRAHAAGQTRDTALGLRAWDWLNLYPGTVSDQGQNLAPRPEPSTLCEDAVGLTSPRPTLGSCQIWSSRISREHDTLELIRKRLGGLGGSVV